MSVVLYNPVCVVEPIQRLATNRIDSLQAKKVGLVFNQHSAAVSFWNSLEREIAEKWQPSTVHRLYKTNTWAPAPKVEMEDLIRNTDFALVGVGA